MQLFSQKDIIVFKYHFFLFPYPLPLFISCRNPNCISRGIFFHSHSFVVILRFPDMESLITGIGELTPLKWNSLLLLIENYEKHPPGKR